MTSDLEQSMQESAQWKAHYDSIRQQKENDKISNLLQKGNTAVITKYKIQFIKWMDENPQYPNPVHISCLEDVRGDFFFVKKAHYYHKVFNYKLVYKECLKRKNLFVGILTNYPIDVTRWNRENPEDPAVNIFDLKSAQSHYYSQVISKSSAKLLGDGKLVAKIAMEAHSRIIYI